MSLTFLERICYQSIADIFFRELTAGSGHSWQRNMLNVIVGARRAPKARIPRYSHVNTGFRYLGRTFAHLRCSFNMTCIGDGLRSGKYSFRNYTGSQTTILFLQSFNCRSRGPWSSFMLLILTFYATRIARRARMSIVTAELVDTIVVSALIFKMPGQWLRSLCVFYRTRRQR